MCQLLPQEDRMVSSCRWNRQTSDPTCWIDLLFEGSGKVTVITLASSRNMYLFFTRCVTGCSTASSPPQQVSCRESTFVQVVTSVSFPSNRWRFTVLTFTLKEQRERRFTKKRSSWPCSWRFCWKRIMLLKTEAGKVRGRLKHTAAWAVAEVTRHRCFLISAVSVVLSTLHLCSQHLLWLTIRLGSVLWKLEFFAFR